MSWLPPLITEDNFPGADPPDRILSVPVALCFPWRYFHLICRVSYCLHLAAGLFGGRMLLGSHPGYLALFVTADQQPDIMEHSRSRNFVGFGFFLLCFLFFFYVFCDFKQCICLSLLSFHWGTWLLTIIFTLSLQLLKSLQQKSSAIKWMKLIY